jgi:hypothetical protein
MKFPKKNKNKKGQNQTQNKAKETQRNPREIKKNTNSSKRRLVAEATMFEYDSMRSRR